MNNLEICKRIAEIEGQVFPSAFWDWSDWLWGYNPLEDKSLCFDFIAKDRMEIHYPYGKDELAYVEAECGAKILINGDLQRAVCLLKIEVNKDE